MVWLTRWIKEHVHNSRILIITDRTELDVQIESVYQGVDEAIYRTTSGADLIDKLSSPLPRLMCSLIHKFPGKDEADVDRFITDLTAALPADFAVYGQFFVFMDECHRTQSGLLHRGMRKLYQFADVIR